jgi:tetratricopeptide (TPR) repeat protein
MRYFFVLLVLAILTVLPVYAEWPKTGNARLDDLLSNAKGAPHAKAFAMYDEALKIDPSCADIFAERAIHFEEAGQYEKAIQDCDKALSLKPNDGVAFVTKARAYLQSGKYEEAVAAADKASLTGGYDELDRDHLRVEGAALYHLGKYQEALVPLSAGMCYARTDNPSADALYYRALCYEKLKRGNDAIKDLDRAIKKAPSRGQYYSARARILKSSGNANVAVKDEEKARSLPKETHTLFY